MIIKRTWTKNNNEDRITYGNVGYFLLGFIPVYVERFVID